MIIRCVTTVNWFLHLPLFFLHTSMHIYLDYICRTALTMKSGDVCMFSAVQVLHSLDCLMVILLLGSSSFSLAPFFSGRLFCTRGWIGVWVFEYCYLLFFKGLLALPWGYCSRNSYLCYSPAYRLLTGTKWKNPTHSVLCFVNMFYCPWFSATYYSVSIFFFPPPFVPTLPGKSCCSI